MTQIAKKLGATHVVNYKREPDWDQVVLKVRMRSCTIFFSDSYDWM